jgi:hypothetical protein
LGGKRFERVVRLSAKAVVENVVKLSAKAVFGLGELQIELTTRKNDSLISTWQRDNLTTRSNNHDNPTTTTTITTTTTNTITTIPSFYEQ